MNTKKGLRRPAQAFFRLRRLSGLRFGGSGIHQRRLPAKNGRRYLLCAPPLKKGKNHRAVGGRNEICACVAVVYLHCGETGHRGGFSAISARMRPRRRAFAPLYIRRFVKKPVKGRRAEAVESPIVCALHPRDAAAFFPCHNGAFLLCPFFLGHQRHSAGLRLRRNTSTVFV